MAVMHRVHWGRYLAEIGPDTWLAKRTPGTKKTEPTWTLYRNGRRVGVFQTLRAARASVASSHTPRAKDNAPSPSCRDGAET